MNIEEIKSAVSEGNIDKIYEIIEASSPSDSEREQLQEIALQHVESNPEVAVAVTSGTSEEFGRGIYKTLIINNRASALKAMEDGEIPGYDTPAEEVLLLIAEHCSPDIWDSAVCWTDHLEESIAELIGAAALIAAKKNPPLYEKLKSTSWIWERPDGNEGSGSVGILAALHSTPEDLREIIAAYEPDLADCAVAAAESGRIENLKVLVELDYDLSRYPLDSSNGTLADIAALQNQTETVEWLEAQGVKRDF